MLVRPVRKGSNGQPIGFTDKKLGNFFYFVAVRTEHGQQSVHSSGENQAILQVRILPSIEEQLNFRP